MIVVATYVVVIVGGEAQVIEEVVCEGVAQIASIELKAKELHVHSLEKPLEAGHD